MQRELSRGVLGALCAPFKAEEIEFRPGQPLGGRAFAHPVLRAAAIRRRLDRVVGRGGWRFEHELLCAGCGRVRGRLTVLGVTKCDAGQAAAGERPRVPAATAEALRRCALMFGIGRYLRYLLPARAAWDAEGGWLETPVLTPEAIACAVAMANTGLLGVEATIPPDCPRPTPACPVARPPLDDEEAWEEFLQAAFLAGWPVLDGAELERRVNRLLGREADDRRAPTAEEWLSAARRVGEAHAKTQSRKGEGAGGVHHGDTETRRGH